jgi:hypothetical protein
MTPMKPASDPLVVLDDIVALARETLTKMSTGRVKSGASALKKIADAASDGARHVREDRAQQAIATAAAVMLNGPATFVVEAEGLTTRQDAAAELLAARWGRCAIRRCEDGQVTLCGLVGDVEMEFHTIDDDAIDQDGIDIVADLEKRPTRRPFTEVPSCDLSGCENCGGWPPPGGCEVCGAQPMPSGAVA